MRHRLCVVGVLAVTFFVAPTARAEEPALEPGTVSKLSLEELSNIHVISVVSAREEPIAEVPATVIVITEQQIRERGYLDLMDVFQDLPGVDFAAYNRALVPTEVAFRGINAAYNMIVVLRDGVPVSPPAAPPKFGRNQPLHDIQRIEVLYGPASVVYGSDAAAAVIQLVSKAAAAGLHGVASLAGGTMDPRKGLDSYATDAHVGVSWRKDGLVARGALRTYLSGGPDLLSLYPDHYAALKSAPAPYTHRFEAPIRGYNAEAAVSWQGLQAGAFFTDQAWPSALGLNPSPPLANLPVDSAVFRYRLLQPYARHDFKRGPVDLRTVVSFGHLETAQSAAIVFGGQHYFQFQQQESLRLDHRTAWSVSEAVTLTGGVRLQSFNIVPLAYTLAEPVKAANVDLGARGLSHVIYSRQGAFVLADVRRGATRKWTLGLAAEHDTKSMENVFLPRGGVVQSLFQGAGHLKAFYGEGYEAAIPDLQYAKFSAQPLVVTANPGLQSERIRSVEVRYEHRLPKQLTAEIGAFYDRVDHLQQGVLVLAPTGITGTTQNLGLLWATGGEVRVHWKQWHRLRAAASYAFVTGEETLAQPGSAEITFDLAKIAKHKVLAEVTVRPYWRLVANVRMRWVGDVTTRATNELFHGQSMPGYTNFNLNVRAEEVLPGLDAHCLFENVTDARYYAFGLAGERGLAPPRVPQPGFRFLLGLTYRL